MQIVSSRDKSPLNLSSAEFVQKVEKHKYDI